MSEAQRLEALAERLRAVEPVKPSPAAKIRGWNLTLAVVQQSATVRSRGYSVRRLVLAAAAAAMLLVVGAVAASADSLPDSPLYPVKSAVEQARGLLAFSPSDKLTYHLDLAQTRLREAEAMIARHRVDLADQALAQLNEQLDEAAQLVAAEQQTDPLLAADLENRLQQAIDVHDRQLAGLQGQVTNPTALAAIAAARDRAAQALQQANNASTSGSHGSGSTGKGQGNGPSATPHPTPKK
jgi:Domain of unknown function (DUF5667)